MLEACSRLAGAYQNTRVIAYTTGDVSGSWRVPPTWDVPIGRLIGPEGCVLSDWATHPLLLFAYSPPFKGTVFRRLVEEHLLSDPSRAHAIPFHFRNQYRHWAPEWESCLPDEVRRTLPAADYQPGRD